MLRILTVVGRYLPGFRAGGPIRSIANMVDWLGDEFEFYIITADRDLGDDRPYPGIQLDKWQTVGKGQVRYMTDTTAYPWVWRQLLQPFDHDVLYLNSCFAASTRTILLLRRLGLLPKRPLILAPRGEFSPGALALKPHRKRWYLRLTRWLGFYAGVIWHASSELEQQDIQRIIGHELERSCGRIIVAPNLPARVYESESDPAISPGLPKTPGQARVVFLSRISRKKNLDGALKMLRNAPGQIQFDIYGPIEDKDYWQECQELIGQLPPRVMVAYRGEIAPEAVPSTLTQYHALLFPTHGENYGHVVLEAWRSGCVVILSDQTPWRGLRERQIGWDVALADSTNLQGALAELLAMEENVFRIWSHAAQAYGRHVAMDTQALAASRKLFIEAVG